MSPLHTADHSMDFRFHIWNFGFKSQPRALSAFPHSCFVVFCANLGSWSWSSYIFSFTLGFLPPSLCVLLSHIWWAQITPALLCRRTRVGVPRGYLHFWKLFRFSDEESSRFASLFIRWMGTDGRQLSSLTASTKQKIINACMRAGVKHFHVLRENVDHSLIPALPWEQLWAATHSGSHQLYNWAQFKLFFFFLITSFVKFYSIPPVPIFQDSLSMLAALLKSGFGRLAFLSLGWFAGLLF